MFARMYCQQNLDLTFLEVWWKPSDSSARSFALPSMSSRPSPCGLQSTVLISIECGFPKHAKNIVISAFWQISYLPLKLHGQHVTLARTASMLFFICPFTRFTFPDDRKEISIVINAFVIVTRFFFGISCQVPTWSWTSSSLLYSELLLLSVMRPSLSGFLGIHKKKRAQPLRADDYFE